MYGEKEEQVQELRLDLQDVKEMYKTQVSFVVVAAVKIIQMLAFIVRLNLKFPFELSRLRCTKLLKQSMSSFRLLHCKGHR